jgi:hypothetical protein
MPLLVGVASPLAVLRKPVRKSRHDLASCDSKTHFDVFLGTLEHNYVHSCVQDDKNSSEMGHPTDSGTETDDNVSVISDDENSEPSPTCQQQEGFFYDALPPQEQQDEGNHDTFPFADGKLSPYIRQKSVQFIEDEIDFTATETSSTTSSIVCDDDLVPLDKPPASSFLLFRINYIIVMVAIMLADGLQGKHLLRGLQGVLIAIIIHVNI